MQQRFVFIGLLNKPFDMLGKTMTSSISSKSFNQIITDFVSTDNAALASHMDCCISKRSRFFNVHAALELAHSVIFSHMVTASVLVGVLLVLVDIV